MTDNAPLANALTALKAAGALVLPRTATIEKSDFGKVWSGKKADGGLWTLTKNNQESYNCMC